MANNRVTILWMLARMESQTLNRISPFSGDGNKDPICRTLTIGTVLHPPISQSSRISRDKKVVEGAVKNPKFSG